MKADPTKKARALASKKSRDGSYVYIDEVDGEYQLSKRRGNNTKLVYKNGSEIAL